MCALRCARTLLVGLVLMGSVSPVSAQRRQGTNEGRLLRDAAARESRGDFAGAEAVLMQLLEGDPASSGGLFALERVLRAKGETVRLLPVVDAFLMHDPSSSGVRYLKLRVLAELDSLDALQGEATSWLEMDPRSEAPYREVARVYERTFGSARALQVLREGRRNTGHEAALALEIGDLLAASGDTDGAIDEWALAVGDDGGQAAAITRRVQGLTSGVEPAARRLVGVLSDSNVLGRRRAGARIALDLGLESEALDLSRSVAGDLDGRAREGFLADVARRARESKLVAAASWAYEALGRGADSPSARRQFDQRIVDVALAAGDTATALDAQLRVAESFSPGSVDRRRARAEVIRLEGAGADPDRLAELLAGFRGEFPNAPELDGLAASVASELLTRGDPVGAAAVLEGIEGPESRIERAYLLFDAGAIEEGRGALLQAVPGLPAAEAIEVIQLAGLLGRLSPAASELLARAEVDARRGEVAAAARDLAGGVEVMEETERAPLLAEAARLADRGGEPAEAARVRELILSNHPDAPEAAEASLELARHRARRPDGLGEAIRILEDLISARPNAAIVPDARLELERLRERIR